MRSTTDASLGLRSGAVTGARDTSDACMLEVRAPRQKELSSRQLQHRRHAVVNGARGNVGHGAAFIGAS
jgi:hypothetical protein